MGALLPFNGVILLAVLVTLFMVQSGITTLKVGDVASSTIVAQRTVTFNDTVATDARRARAAAAVSPVYVHSTSLAITRRTQAEAFFKAGTDVMAANAPSSAKLVALKNMLPAGVSGNDFQILPTLSLTDYRGVESTSLALLAQATAWRFDAAHIETTEISLLSTVSTRVPVQQRTAIGEVIMTFLAPTLLPDPKLTAARRAQAASAIPMVRSTVHAGEVIVRRGDVVTPFVMERLSALGLQGHDEGWQDLAGAVLFTGAIVLMLFWYLYSFFPAITQNGRVLLLIDVSLVLSVLGARLLSTGHALLPLFLPLAAAPTFAAVLVAPEACVALGLAMSLLAGWVVANSFELSIYYFLSGAAGVLAIRQVKTVRQFILTGPFIAVFALLTLLGFGFADRTYDIGAIQDYVLASAFNGFISASLALGGFAVLSEFFGVTTSLQLLELAQPSQELLRRLMTRAPGTYNHALILSTMVERAADEIGADPLVAKVGALYHDVGKLTNPLAFAENQMGVANMHDDLRPEESGRIIRGHVTQGVRLARQSKLPRIIVDAILEHHGTMQIAYFLHKARQTYGEGVDPSEYMYPGPKPQTRETALIMLADGCESAVRAASEHTREAIAQIVDRIFADRIATGQLDECPLTLRDVELARTAFYSVLNGLYHPRVEYPDSAEPISLEARKSGTA